MLHSAFMSLLRVIFHNLRWTLPAIDKFPNIKRIKNIDCPIYIIHGSRDELVHVSHAHRMWEKVSNKIFQPHFVELAGHNNVEKHCKDYL